MLRSASGKARASRWLGLERPLCRENKEFGAAVGTVAAGQRVAAVMTV